MRKEKKRLLSLLIAISFIFTSFGFNSINVFAADNQRAVDANDSNVQVLYEGFTGADKNAAPANEGWILLRQGQAATQIGGYSSSGYYGEASPSLGFGRAGKGEEILESPSFSLLAEGNLSFYHKAAYNGEFTSTLVVEILVDGKWQQVDGIDLVNDGIFNASIPKETSKVKFTFNKVSGNLAIDDIKVTYDVNAIEKVDGLVDIADARALADDTETKVRGVVSFNDRGNTLHIQDSTGAIAVYKDQLDLSGINAGDYIEINGRKSTYKGMIQIYAAEAAVIVEGKGMPKAELHSIEELNTGAYDSKYVEIENAIYNSSAKTLTQGSDVLNIYYIPTGLDIVTGDVVNVKGTMGSYNGTVQIYGSSCTFTKVENADLEAPQIKHESVVKAPIEADLKITAEITDNVSVKKASLFYRTAGSTVDYQETAMDNAGGNNYEAIINKDELTLDGIEYYITATDGSNKTTSDIFTVNIVDEDMAGPEIFDLVPEKGTSIGDEGKPEIRASFKDKTAVNVGSVKIYVDSEDVTSKAAINENGVKYIPAKELKDGNHIVKIEVADTLGNVSTIEWNFRKGNLNHYFGQLHSHTNISDGAGSLNDAYEWAKKNGADYIGVTDHSNWFDNDTSANINDGSASTKWVDAHNVADKYNEENVFTAIYGYEMTWSGSTGGWGHINTFNTDGFETRTNSAMDLANYYGTISGVSESLSQLNHPGKTFGDFADFGYYSEAVDDVVFLVEVGNGEGEIGGSGYFPSYEYYTRALDKGWHVAPSNNQDNHKGKWYTSNTARTVILAEENTREGLYNAIRNLRVYASEDANMTVEYTVNDNVMGSILEETNEKLKFNVSAADQDKNDKIARISIIANGGTEVISKEFNSEEASWQFELSPEYSYYYVKVVQADGQIAVTAPVWVGESVNVGLQEAKVDNELTLPNEDVEISLGVYNNSSEVLKDVKIEYYLNEIKENAKFGEQIIDTVAVSETKEAVYSWKAEKAGEYTIYAKVTMSANGVDKSFTTSVKVSVANPMETYKAVIDGAHYNQYVSGNYSGNYTALKEKLIDRNAVTVINKEEITSKTLEGVDLLVLTNPQSRDKASSNLYASKYKESEIEAIKEYAANGGHIILTTIADYGDGTGEYSNNAQMNPILEAIGTELRINDDQVIDDTTNGGQAYRLYFNKYSSENYGLTNGIENGVDLFSFYSGASVILAQGAAGDKVDFIVKGHETTTTSDADNQGDNIEVAKGDVSVLGAEELANGSKVVVGGNTFFSDFETSGSSADTYSNGKIVDNILEWMLPEKEAEKANIADLRVDADKDNVPDLLGQKFVVEGYVTSQSEAVAPKNAFFEVVYIEDATGGICVFGISNTELKVGQKVRVTGRVDAYQGEFEIQISDEAKDLEIIDENISEVTPTLLSTYESMEPINGGKLVKVQGKVVGMDEANIYVDDGTGISRAFVEGYIWDGIDESTKGRWNPEIQIGDTVSVIGLASMDPEGARLRVRNTGEISLVNLSNESGDGDDSNNGDDSETGDKPGNPGGSTDEEGNGGNSGDITDDTIDPDTSTDDKDEEADDIPGNQNGGQDNNEIGSSNDEISVNENTDKDNSANKEETGSMPVTGGTNSMIYVVIALAIIVGGALILYKNKKKK